MIVFDIETSGLDAEVHGILSIGAVDMTQPSERFYAEARLREGEKIDPVALQINGFTLDDCRDKSKMAPRDLIEQFIEWVEQRPIKVIAGLHVAAFDVPFFNRKAKQMGFRYQLHKRSIDLHSIAYAKILALGQDVPYRDGWSVVDTDFIHPFCGLPPEPKPHNALQGALWETESLYRLIYGKTLLNEFNENTIPSFLFK